MAQVGAEMAQVSARMAQVGFSPTHLRRESASYGLQWRRCAYFFQTCAKRDVTCAIRLPACATWCLNCAEQKLPGRETTAIRKIRLDSPSHWRARFIPILQY